MSSPPEIVTAVFFLLVGIGIIVLGIYNLRHRKPHWWNGGFPIFNGVAELLFGSVIIFAMIYHINELVSE